MSELSAAFFEEQSRYNDEQRHTFLIALDNSDRIEVSDWEVGFLDNTLPLVTFTAGQRNVIQTLINKYAHRMGWKG